MTPSELRAAAGNVMAGIMSATMCPVCQGRDFDKHVDEQTPVTILVCQECGFDGDESYFKTRELAPERTSDAEEMAEHILATVRDDDREPITAEWWRTLSHAWFADLEGDEKLCLLVHDDIQDDPDCRLLAVFSDDGSWGFWEQRRDTNELCNPHHNRFKPVKTRGQVRDLCRVLGIELKETP